MFRTKINTSRGEITVKNVMIDVDGTNLEEGIDIHFGDHYLGNMVGYSVEDVNTEDAEELEDWLFQNWSTPKATPEIKSFEYYILSITATLRLVDTKYTKSELIFAFLREFRKGNRRVHWDDVEPLDGYIAGSITELIKVKVNTDMKGYMKEYLAKNKDWCQQEFFGLYKLEGYYSTPQAEEILTEDSNLN